ncbi:methionyl-tRNA formyltransferase [bacterium]|nr:methionyl-tRNA formyltransferase [bacterium]
MKIIFLASGKFSIPTLQLLANYRPEIELMLISQPDRNKGRGRKIAPTPARETALDLGIETKTPKSVNSQEGQQIIADFAPDYLVLVDYGIKLSPETIALPKSASINLHPSLLPAYRGPAPMPWALINGEPITGVTTQMIGEEIDCGNILLQEPTFILDHETLPQLAERLGRLGAPLIWRTISELNDGTLQSSPQDERLASKAPKLKKEDGLIDWQSPAVDLFNRIRGLNPWPGTYTFLRGKRVKIITAQPALGTYLLPPGALFIENNQLLVGCGQADTLRIDELQIAGKPPRTAADFLRGHKINDNDTFNSK